MIFFLLTAEDAEGAEEIEKIERGIEVFCKIIISVGRSAIGSKL